MEVTLSLRAVSGYWTPQTQTAYANSDLKIKLEDYGQIKYKAVLFFNGAAFLFDENNELTISANKIKEINYCILQDKTEVGNVIKEWRFIETLFFDLEKLDKTGEKSMLAEREFFKEIKEKFNKLTEAYEQATSSIQTLAKEVIRQGEALAEIRNDVESIKNEPII